MKFSYKKLLLFSLTACTLLSCKKELNVLPTDRQVDGNVIIDAKSAAAVLNGVYYRFANADKDNNGIPVTKWMEVSEKIPSQLSGLLSDRSNNILSDLLLSPSYPDVAGIWRHGYQLVNSVNGFLKNLEPVATIDEGTKKIMKAEALFLRAFGHAELLLYYGQYKDINSPYGIIIRSEFVTSENMNLPRSGVKESYDFILADLDAAIADLPSSINQLSRANVWVAKLLKARILINRGTASDYKTVISLTDDLINNSPFQLEALTKDIFLTKGFQSKEVMMSVPPYTNDSYKYIEYQYYTQYRGTAALTAMMTGDPRAAWTVKQKKLRNIVNVFSKYYSGDLDTIALTPLAINNYAFRLTEAYLLKAEALVLSGGSLTTARNLLKTVMGHAGFSNFSVVDNAGNAADLHVLIVKETMKNFIGENGLDWLALRRLPFATIQVLRPAVRSENFLLLPIPSAETLNNGLIQQNPGYTTY